MKVGWNGDNGNQPTLNTKLFIARWRTSGISWPARYHGGVVKAVSGSVGDGVLGARRRGSCSVECVKLGLRPS